MGYIKAHGGKRPQIGERVYLAQTAAVIGDVALGDDVSVWYNSVVRGDCNSIRIGDRSNVQDNCAIHVTQAKYSDGSRGGGHSRPRSDRPRRRASVAGA